MATLVPLAGQQPDTSRYSDYVLVGRLFVRVLGVVYAVAFVSFGVQVLGLVGSGGILPVAEHLNAVAAEVGPERYLLRPTLFWLEASDAALVGATVLGALLGLLIALGRLVRPALIGTFVLYLSLYHAGQEFLTYQWDGLLLEAGFLAIFLTPRSRAVVWLFRWLLFRLRFMSGLAKLTMHDPTWAGLTALDYYFEVQPLPTPLAWYAHHLPDGLLRVGTAGTLVVEILVPLMMFLPRGWRFAAAWLTILWQVLILLTSNHNWFNVFTIALCLFLFDDRALRRVLPAGLADRLATPNVAHTSARMFPRFGIGVLLAMVVGVSTLQFWELATARAAPGVLGSVLDYAEAFRVVNKFHVFATMKTERIEIEISGSLDGEAWTPYPFRYKPGEVTVRPAVVIPHQPRLDWQMWFLTLNRRQLPWFERFLRALLENRPAVTALLRDNPFASQPPRYLRVEAWRYRFSTPQERAATGAWWQRVPLGPFLPLPGMQRFDD